VNDDARLNDDARRAVSRFALVALVLPAVIVAAGVAVMLAVLPALPDPVAIHWGGAGTPDGFGPPWVPVVLLAVCGFGLPALLGLLSLPALRRGGRGYAYPFLAASALGLSCFLTVLVTASTVRQAGLADAASGPTIWLPMAGGLVAGIGAGIIGWFLQPQQRFEPTPVRAADPAQLTPGEHAVWLQRVAISRSGGIILGAAVGLLIAITAITAWAVPDALALWITAGSTVLVTVAVATNVVFHVRVDERGLTVTSAAGWPRTRVPLADVRDAAAVTVDPMGEFGGWGMRWAPPGRFGVVVRAGAGIEVRRRSGKTFTVTVDDADTGTALLNALVETRGASGRTSPAG